MDNQAENYSLIYKETLKNIFIPALKELTITRESLVADIIASALEDAIKEAGLEGKIDVKNIIKRLPMAGYYNISTLLADIGMEMFFYPSSPQHCFYFKKLDSGALIVSGYPRTPLDEVKTLNDVLKKRLSKAGTVYLDLAPAIGLLNRFRKFRYSPQKPWAFDPWKMKVISPNDMPDEVKALLKKLYANPDFILSSGVLRTFLPDILQNPLLTEDG